MKSTRLLTALYALLCISSLHAQVAAVPSPPDKAVGSYFSDHRFIDNAVEYGLNQISLSQMAASKSTSMAVRKFAERVANDQAAANSELMELARQRDFSAPIHVDKTRAKNAKLLETEPSPQFDTDYLQQMAGDSDKAIALFTAASDSTDSKIVLLSKKSLSLVQQHQTTARKLLADLAAEQPATRE